ncbi:MAG: hypothetical protein U9N32_03980 [Spirochaetota bacterium]|nr:hypothetical protein [Spirochaetota bacterium]
MKKLLLILILTSIIVPFTFSFSEETRADLRRAAAWWSEREDKLYSQLVDLREKNPDPGNPNDRNWQEYLRITAEVQKAQEKQKLYEDTALFNYNRLVARDTVQVYRPVGDFMEFTLGRGFELFNAVISQSWTDLVKLSVDSILRTRIRGKIRSILDCNETVMELENWMVVIGFGDNPWETTLDQSLLNWAKGDAEGKAMLLALQGEQGRQIYNKFLENPQKITNMASKDGNPLNWLESTTKKPAEEIMDKLGMATFVADMASRMWLSFEMDESINNTLQNLKAIREKYKEKEIELSCKDVFLVWSKQKSIDLVDPEEKKKLEDLKLGLDFFIKKIPGWYSTKTVPDHFEEIVRMIPIAEELGEYTTANNLRDILVEFEYHKMTPDEIAAAELESIIEETRGYSINSLKILRKYLINKDYDEVENQWDRTEAFWNELISLKYDIDSDTEIQNLWAEIEPMLSNVPELIKDNSLNGNNRSSSNLSFDLPNLNEIDYKDKFLIIAKKYNNAVINKNYNRAKSLKIVFEYYGKYLYEKYDISIHNSEEWFKNLVKYFDFDYNTTVMVDEANSLLNNPNSNQFKSEIMDFYSEYESKLRSIGEEAIDYDLIDLEPYTLRWGLMGIEYWEDGFKDSDINAKREYIESLEDSIRDGDVTPNGSGDTTNNHDPTTTNSGF